jgi:hypothetical protein
MHCEERRIVKSMKDNRGAELRLRVLEDYSYFEYLRGNMNTARNDIDIYRKYRRIQCIVFWVIPRRLSFKGRRFGTECQFHPLGKIRLHGQTDQGSD